MKNIISLLFYIFISFMFFKTQLLNAQKTGKINNTELGFSFIIPEDWTGYKASSGFAITSSKIGGVILVISHNVSSISEIEKEANNGFKIGENTLLNPIRNVQKVSDSVVVGMYTGVIDSKSAKALIIGMVNPHGNGITILCTANTNLFSEDLMRAGLSTMESVAFHNPKKQTSTIKISDAPSEQSRIFKDCRLTYMESYSTSGGGYSNRTTIDLCAKGYFIHSSVNHISMDTGGSSGYGGNNKKGSGTWLLLKKQQQLILELTFHNGEIYEYYVTIDENEKTFLNGQRYFRTYKGSGKYSPQCD